MAGDWKLKKSDAYLVPLQIEQHKTRLMISRNVKRGRVQMRIQQRDMATRLGITLRTYQRVESGNTMLSAALLERIGRLQGHCMDWYMHDRGICNNRVRGITLHHVGQRKPRSSRA